MKPEQAERFLIEELFNKTQDKNILKDEKKGEKAISKIEEEIKEVEDKLGD